MTYCIFYNNVCIFGHRFHSLSGVTQVNNQLKRRGVSPFLFCYCFVFQTLNKTYCYLYNNLIFAYIYPTLKLKQHDQKTRLGDAL